MHWNGYPFRQVRTTSEQSPSPKQLQVSINALTCATLHGSTRFHTSFRCSITSVQWARQSVYDSSCLECEKYEVPEVVLQSSVWYASFKISHKHIAFGVSEAFHRSKDDGPTKSGGGDSVPISFSVSVNPLVTKTWALNSSQFILVNQIVLIWVFCSIILHKNLIWFDQNPHVSRLLYTGHHLFDIIPVSRDVTMLKNNCAKGSSWSAE